MPVVLDRRCWRWPCVRYLSGLPGSTISCSAWNANLHAQRAHPTNTTFHGDGNCASASKHRVHCQSLLFAWPQENSSASEFIFFIQRFPLTALNPSLVLITPNLIIAEHWIFWTKFSSLNGGITWRPFPHKNGLNKIFCQWVFLYFLY